MKKIIDYNLDINLEKLSSFDLNVLYSLYDELQNCLENRSKNYNQRTNFTKELTNKYYKAIVDKNESIIVNKEGWDAFCKSEIKDFFVLKDEEKKYYILDQESKKIAKKIVEYIPVPELKYLMPNGNIIIKELVAINTCSSPREIYQLIEIDENFERKKHFTY